MKAVLICVSFMIYLVQAATDHSTQEKRTSDVHQNLNPHALRTGTKVVGCPEGCSRIGSECYMRLPSCSLSWDESLQKCSERNLSLAEPEDFQAVAQYLYNNNTIQHCHVRNDVAYWLGAQGPINGTVQWVSGGVIGADAPWVDQRNYERCIDHSGKPPACLLLANEDACETAKFCIGCTDCSVRNSSTESYGLNTLCECQPIFGSECSPECIHGECVGPNQCKCEPGWMGPLCDIEITWPYVGDKCCNLSTTSKCSKKGGKCIPKNETCIGDVYNGPSFCDFNNLKSCKCCVPSECETLSPCAAMNGTCNTTCKGKSVTGKDFCKDHEFCQCCLPDDCPCGQDLNGGCRGQLESGDWAEGTCRKTCEIGTGPLLNHTCSQTGGGDCMCCAPLTINDCFQVGSESFRTLNSNWIMGNEAWQNCAQFNHILAEPTDLHAVAKYIFERAGYQNYGQHFWIDAYTNENGTVQWGSGGVIGPDYPYWGRPTEHDRCSQQNMCMVLQVRRDCITDNTCLFCLPCNTTWVTRAPLCECELITG